MIFVGQGALLRRAVLHARQTGVCIDLICSPAGADGSHPAAYGDIPFRAVEDINGLADELVAVSTDGIIWSVNNPMIFRSPLLSSSLRILNIHHGPLPAYRGLPEVALIYAILNGESTYAATLHEVDEGIDTGRRLAAESYPIGHDEPYHLVMRRGLSICHRLFERTLRLVAADPNWPGDALLSEPDTAGRYFGRKELTQLHHHRLQPDFGRATDLGALREYFPNIANALRSAEADLGTVKR
ncbi:formyltransferase family protein [Streptomyces sp. NPDC057686]|uniref:formyltransferase family protein n=1 Tax=Streptomyces sp. NPDC057686 TaxID=3346212 RepID=UPI0036C86E8F